VLLLYDIGHNKLFSTVLFHDDQKNGFSISNNVGFGSVNWIDTNSKRGIVPKSVVILIYNNDELVNIIMLPYLIVGNIYWLAERKIFLNTFWYPTIRGFLLIIAPLIISGIVIFNIFQY
jgi:hypothetical protein